MKRAFLFVTTIILCVSLVSTFSLIGCQEETVAEEPAEEEGVEEIVEEAPAEEEEEAPVEEEAPAEEEEEAEPVALEFWTVHPDDDPIFGYFERAGEIVEEEHNITVNVVSKGTADYRELLTASAASQSGPDVVFNWPGLADIVTGGKQGLHLPLNDLFSEDELGSLQAIGACTDPETGLVYGVPYALNFIGFGYNKSLMEEAGIDYENFPAKWDYNEFLDVCAQLKDAGITPVSFANKEGYFADWWHSFFVPSYVDEIEEVIPIYQEKPTYREPFISFLENWKDFFQNGYYVEGGHTIGIANLGEQFINGDAAMTVCFTASVPAYVEGIGEENFGLIEWPSMGDGELAKANPVYGDGVGITNWTSYPEEAAIYLKTILFNEEIVAEFAKTGNPPVSDKFEGTSFDIENEAVAEFMEKHQTMPTFYEGHAFWGREYSSVIEKFCNLMLQGEMSIEEYCLEIDDTLE